MFTLLIMFPICGLDPDKHTGKAGLLKPRGQVSRGFYFNGSTPSMTKSGPNPLSVFDKGLVIYIIFFFSTRQPTLWTALKGNCTISRRLYPSMSSSHDFHVLLQLICDTTVWGAGYCLMSCLWVSHRCIWLATVRTRSQTGRVFGLIQEVYSDVLFFFLSKY